METKFNRGDKVRYVGKAIRLLGLEGVVTDAGNNVTTIEITKGNASHVYGDIVYPDTGNLVSVEAVDHPAHYGGADNPYEVIKVIEAWGLGFNLGNVVKYVARAGKKDPEKELEDLKKGQFYINRRVAQLEAANADNG